MEFRSRPQIFHACRMHAKWYHFACTGPLNKLAEDHCAVTKSARFRPVSSEGDKHTYTYKYNYKYIHTYRPRLYICSMIICNGFVLKSRYRNCPVLSKYQVCTGLRSKRRPPRNTCIALPSTLVIPVGLQSRSTS